MFVIGFIATLVLCVPSFNALRMLPSIAITYPLRVTSSAHTRRAHHAAKGSDSAGSENDTYYDFFGTLSRAGPSPLFFRIFLKDKYEAAVNKFRLQERCSLREAQANMDMYFQNSNDWLAQRVKDEKRGVKTDYLNMYQDPKSIALTVIWGTGATALLVRILTALAFYNQK